MFQNISATGIPELFANEDRKEGKKNLKDGILVWTS